MIEHQFLKGSLLFLTGALFGMFIFYFQIYGLESPFSLSAGGISAPNDWVSEENIHLYKDKIVIDIDGATMSKYASTGSMKPVFDKGANGIRIVPETEEQISVGDIVTYEREGILIVHRVVEIGEDNGGKYFVIKGDNNESVDGKIRFEDIKYVTIAVIY